MVNGLTEGPFNTIVIFSNRVLAFPRCYVYSYNVMFIVEIETRN